MGAYDEYIAGKTSGENLGSVSGGAYDDYVAGLSKDTGGFVASVKQTVGVGIKGAGQVGADYLPFVGQDNFLKKYGQSVIDANPTAIHDLGDIAESPFKALKEAAGNAGASVAEMVGARALGMALTSAAPAAGPLAPAVALIGQLIAWVGPMAIASLPSYSGIRDKQILNDPQNQEDGKAKAIAALGAATVGAIETKFGPQDWALAAMTKEGRIELAKKFSGSKIENILVGIGKGSAIEGAEELVQNPIEQLTSFDDPTTEKNLKDTLFGGAMGTLGGGVLGGGFGMVAPRANPVQKILNAPQDIDAIVGAASAAADDPATMADLGDFAGGAVQDVRGLELGLINAQIAALTEPAYAQKAMQDEAARITDEQISEEQRAAQVATGTPASLLAMDAAAHERRNAEIGARARIQERNTEIAALDSEIVKWQDNESIGVIGRQRLEGLANRIDALEAENAADNELLKGGTNAVQKSGTAGVDVRQPSGNGETLAGRNAQGRETPGAQGDRQQATAQEEGVNVQTQKLQGPSPAAGAGVQATPLQGTEPRVSEGIDRQTGVQGPVAALDVGAGTTPAATAIPPGPVAAAQPTGVPAKPGVAPQQTPLPSAVFEKVGDKALGKIAAGKGRAATAAQTEIERRLEVRKWIESAPGRQTSEWADTEGVVYSKAQAAELFSAESRYNARMEAAQSLRARQIAGKKATRLKGISDSVLKGLVERGGKASQLAATEIEHRGVMREAYRNRDIIPIQDNELSSMNRLFIKTVKAITGLNIDLFKDGPGGHFVEGFVLPEDTATIHVNVDSKRQVQIVARHEVTHIMATKFPEVHNTMRKSINAAMTDGAFDEIDKKYPELRNRKGTQNEELIANVVGDHGDDFRVWLGVFGHTKDVRALVKALFSALNQLHDKLTGAQKQGYDTSQFIKDHGAVRAAIAKAYAQWEKGAQEGATKEGGVQREDALQSKPEDDAIDAIAAGQMGAVEREEMYASQDESLARVDESSRPLAYLTDNELKEMARRLGVDVSSIKDEEEKLPPGVSEFKPKSRGGDRVGEALRKIRRDRALQSKPDRPLYFRSANANDISRLKVPPAWTDVYVAANPNASLIAVGMNKKGVPVYLYSAEHTAAALVEKFRRGREFNDALPGLMETIERDAKDGNEEAAVLRLLAHSGFRIGSGKIRGEQEVFGATTLRQEHVKVDGDTVHFDFKGKAGIQQTHSITNTDLAREISERIERNGNKIYETTDRAVRRYLDSISEDKFIVHDFRTWNATDAARQAIAGMPVPQNAEQYWDRRDRVLDAAASKIGDSRAVAEEVYVDPFVFDGWRTQAGVREDAKRPRRSADRGARGADAGALRDAQRRESEGGRPSALQSRPDQAAGESSANPIVTARQAVAHDKATPPEKSRLGRCHQLTWRKVVGSDLRQIIGVINGFPKAPQPRAPISIWHSVAFDPKNGNFWEPSFDRWFTPAAMKAFGFEPVASLTAERTAALAAKTGKITDQQIYSENVKKLRGAESDWLSPGDYDADWKAVGRGTALQSKPEGVTAEIAPNPDRADVSAKWQALPYNDRLRHSIRIGGKMVTDVARGMGIPASAYRVFHTIGGFEGRVNPSMNIQSTLPYNELMEFGQMLGYTASQKSIITYNEAITEGEGIAQFVKIFPSRTISADEQDAIFQRIYRQVQEASGFTGRGGAMVFGNFSGLEEDSFRDKIGAVLKDDRLHFTTISSRFRSDYIGEPVTLEGTRYDRNTQKNEAGRNDLRRGQWHPDTVRASVERQLQRALQSKADERGADTGRTQEAEGTGVRADGDRLRGGRDEGVGRQAGRQRVAQGYAVHRESDGPVFSRRPQQPNAVTLVGYHYGKRADLGSLDGDKFGTGTPSEESRRATIRNRIYFYPKTTGIPKPERVVRTEFVYRAVFGNIYDTWVDPSIPKKVRAENGGQFALNAFEDAVVAAGYDGYLSRNHADAGGIVLLNVGKVPVQYIGERGRALESKPDIETREDALREWAKGTKVVDEDGDPMVMYHGTNADIKAFDIRTASWDNLLGQGFYFTKNREYASKNASGRGGNVMPVYLSIKSPASVEVAEEAADRLEVGDNRKPKKTDFRDALEALGYDGIIGDKPDFDEYVAVVFRPEQIKSVFNRGTFDPKKKNILQSKPDYEAEAGNFRDRVDARERADAWARGDITQISRKRAAGRGGIPRIEWGQRPRQGTWTSLTAHGRYTIQPHFKGGREGFWAMVDGEELRFEETRTDAIATLNDQYEEDIADGVVKDPREAKSVLKKYKPDVVQRVVDGWQQLARAPGIFLSGRSDKKKLADVFRELDVNKVVQSISLMHADAAGATWTVAFNNGKVAFVNEDAISKTAYVEVSNFDKGSQLGSFLYPTAFTWARNNGLKLMVDPARLSAVNTYRRTEQMMSAALKYGNTEFMSSTDAAGGGEWQGLYGWNEKPATTKDEEKNIAILAITAMKNTFSKVGPIIEDWRYNFDKKQFEDENGETVDLDKLKGVSLSVEARKWGIGPTTIARAIFTNTLIHESTGSEKFITGDIAPSSLLADEKEKRTLVLYSKPNGASWDSPEPSRMDDILYIMQDKHIDTRRVLEKIRKHVAVSDTQDVRLKEELYHGRVAKRVDDFLSQELKPLVMEMAGRQVTMPELEKYLHARHAEERNIQIAKINQKLPDGGSGMDTKDARIYLSGLAPDKKRAYEALAKRVDAINEKTRQAVVSYTLESQKTVDAWEAVYKHYVPLHREDMDGSPGTGQGFSIRGPATKRAMGSKRAVVDILANIAAQREKTIVRGEKNRFDTALVGLVGASPNTDFWEVDTPPKIKYVDERTGLVTERVDPLYKSRENVVMARIPDASGEIVEHAVVFNEFDDRAMRMAASLKNLDMDDLGHVLGLSAKITRYFASVNTQYNPVFGVVNITRDVQGAMLNLSSTELAGEQVAVLKNTLSALRGIYIDTRDVRQGKAATSKWARLWEEFQGVGGKTGYRDMFRTGKDRGEAIEREFKRASEGKAMGAGRAVFDWLSDYNTAMENAVRLSAYKVGIDNGMTKERAASLAKNLTVNFNRKGQIATQAGALYAFFNASVQGTARLAETLAGPAGRKIITGGLALGVVQALALAAAGFDDDEPPEFVRERNIIIPIGDKKYITIPMPLGLHVLPNISRIAAEFSMSGFRNPGKRLTDLIGVFAEAFNPIGNAGLSLQTIAPTAIDPLAAIAENQDWTGRPIAREDMNKLSPTPGHTRAKDTATEFSKAVSKGLNWVSGGTNYKPGMFSPTPDQIDYLIGQATGGVGREVMKAEQTITSAITGEDLPTYKVPLLGRIYGDAAQQSSQANTFYTNLKMLNEHEAEIKGRRKSGEPMGDYFKENPEARLFAMANGYERSVSELRKRKRVLVEKDANREQIKAVELQIAARMTRLNEQVRRVRESRP